MGAVLKHDENNERWSVAHWLRTLNEDEKNYAVHNLEFKLKVDTLRHGNNTFTDESSWLIFINIRYDVLRPKHICSKEMCDSWSALKNLTLLSSSQRISNPI